MLSKQNVVAQSLVLNAVSQQLAGTVALPANSHRNIYNLFGAYLYFLPSTPLPRNCCIHILMNVPILICVGSVSLS